MTQKYCVNFQYEVNGIFWAFQICFLFVFTIIISKVILLINILMVTACPRPYPRLIQTLSFLICVELFFVKVKKPCSRKMLEPGKVDKTRLGQRWNLGPKRLISSEKFVIENLLSFSNLLVESKQNYVLFHNTYSRAKSLTNGLHRLS